MHYSSLSREKAKMLPKSVEGTIIRKVVQGRCKRMTKERDYFFDNLKAVLIFLVVLGHFLLPIHGDNPLVVVKRLIYIFHMPLFVFVSGYFAKKIYKNGQYNFKKILYLI